MYGKANDFHQSRRSWYLPISPTPPHPDATSKKGKKRFPTLELSDNAVLRWDSYVNLRDVYKIDWSYLRPYGNTETQYHQDYRFHRESMIRLLAKGKQLTGYFPDQRQALEGIPAVPQQRSPSPSSPMSPYSPPHSPTWTASSAPSPVQPWAGISSTSEQRVQYSPHIVQRPFLGKPHGQYSAIKSPGEIHPDGRKPEQIELFGFIFRYLLKWPWNMLRRFWATMRRKPYSQI